MKMLSGILQFITGYRKWKKKKKQPHNICDIERILKYTNIDRAQNTQKIKEKYLDLLIQVRICVKVQRNWELQEEKDSTLQ